MGDIKEQVGQLEAQRDHGGVVRLCHRLLKSDQSPKDRVFTLVSLAKNLAAMNPLGWLSTIRSALNEAIAIAKGDAEQVAQLYVALSASEVPLRQPEQIQTTLHRFENLVAKASVSDATFNRGLIIYNIALSAEKSGDLGQAEYEYRRSVECFREHHAETGKPLSLQWIGLALHNLAHVLVKAGQVNEARTAAGEAHPLIPEAYGGAKMLCLQGKILAAGGDLEGARQLLTNALTHPSLDDFTRVDVLHVWAEVDLAAGDREEAVARARGAYITALRLPYPDAAERLEWVLHQAGEGN